MVTDLTGGQINLGMSVSSRVFILFHLKLFFCRFLEIKIIFPVRKSMLFQALSLKLPEIRHVILLGWNKRFEYVQYFMKQTPTYAVILVYK